MSEIVTKVELKNKNGALLNTARRYCRHPILVMPRLYPLEVNENGTYPVPRGYAGFGQVKVNVQPLTETSLVITKNGTYQAPIGTAYTSITVAVTPEESAPAHTCRYTATDVPATCETVGYRRYTCETCGKTYDSDPTPALGHQYVGGVCSVCGKIDPNNQPENEVHDFNLTVGQSFSLTAEGSQLDVEFPDCLTMTKENGILTFTAAVAGSGTLYLRQGETLVAAYHVRVSERTAADTHTHQFASRRVSPSCTAEGYTEHICACGATYRDTPIAPLGHEWSEPYASEGFASGYGHVCSRCGRAESLEPPDHSCRHQFVFTRTVPATCTGGGYDLYTCELCGATHVMNQTSALGHAPGNPILLREATCDTPPLYQVRCSRCGAELQQYEDDGAMKPHTEDGGTTTLEPTCTTTGIREYRCTSCDALLRIEHLPQKAHTWDVWEDTSASSGYSRTCTKCGETEYDITP